MSAKISKEQVEAEKDIRKGWKVGDWLEVFSKSRNEWFKAKVIEVYKDEDGEWLAVVVENTMIKEVQRYNDDVRPIPVDNNESSSEESESDSDTSEISDDSSEYDTDDSNISDNTKKKKRQKKKQKQQSKHHEMNVIFVDNVGTDICRGKYSYLTTTEDGYPSFENVNKKNMIIHYNEDEFQWEFKYKQDIYYVVEKDSEFPPSFGWIKKKGIFPVPSVRIVQIKNKEKDDVFFEDDPYKFSPFSIMKHEIDCSDNKLGFTLHDIQLHSQFVGIASIIPDSTAQKVGLKPGDVLVSVETEDLSKIKSHIKALELIKKCITESQTKKLIFTFAREKDTFKIIMCQRGGTKIVNGKYSIMDQKNDALQFANNDNLNMRILRIYVNEDDDEAIWAVREVNVPQSELKKKKSIKNNKSNKKSKDNNSNHIDETKNDDKNDNKNQSNSSSTEGEDESGSEEEEDDDNHRDYYIVLTSAKAEFPPECGWEAVGEGIWPAPGLTYYDVNLVQPKPPIITRCQPNPNAIQIHFECDTESRKPKVCPHMRVWYEVEMRHYVPIEGTNRVKIQTKMWEIDESPFVANKLTNGDEYSFIVRTCNVISSANSKESKRVIPLQLPPKPKITNISGKPNELYIHFHCPNYKDKDVQASFEIIVDPPINEQSQIYKIKDHRLLVNNDNEPVRLLNLKNGTSYRMIVASVNTVGVTYSEPETAYPSKEPPQPQLTNVESGNREIIVNFKCDGYDKNDTLAWFEVELDPPPPKLIETIKEEKAKAASLKKNGDGDDVKNDNNGLGHVRDKSVRFKQKLARKSRWRRQTTTKRMMGNVFSPKGAFPVGGFGNHNNFGDNDDEKSIGKLIEEESDDFIPYFRREKRYNASPIKITPVVNGISYIVRIKSVTLSGQKITAFSQALIPKGPPPMPKIVKVTPKQSAVEVEFECDDYATEEYQAKYDIESQPNSVTTKTKLSPTIVTGLTNGRNYKFKVRAHNSEGKSKWSELSQQATPLKIPPIPTDLTCVAYDHELTVYWVCEELKTPEYSGWYEIDTIPATYTMVVTRAQARFRRLDNGKEYAFTISAVNQVGRSTSTQECKGIPNEKITKDDYLRKKKRVACVVREKLLESRKERKKKAAMAKNEQRASKLAKFKNFESKQSRKAQLEKQNRKKKKKELAKKREVKKQREKESRKRKMEEQRAKVLQNKRRISFLHRQRIDNLQTQMSSRKGNNANTALSMFGAANKKPLLKIDKKSKKIKNHSNKSSKNNTPLANGNSNKSLKQRSSNKKSDKKSAKKSDKKETPSKKKRKSKKQD